MAAFLDSLPNRSEYVRRAILLRLGRVCPLCDGVGALPTGVAEHFAEALAANRHARCVGCGRAEPLPACAGRAGKSHPPHWAAFLLGGPFRCPACRGEPPAE